MNCEIEQQLFVYLFYVPKLEINQDFEKLRLMFPQYLLLNFAVLFLSNFLLNILLYFPNSFRAKSVQRIL